jgi:uncharacterized membrane protein
VTWTAVLLAAGGCYLLKLTGLSVPRRALEHPRVERAGARVPVALLAALIATSTFGDGRRAAPALRTAGTGQRGRRGAMMR